jgi:hypothetical protein
MGLLICHFPYFGRGARRRQPRDGLEWLHVACCSATRAKKSLLFPVRDFARKLRFAEIRWKKFFSPIALVHKSILIADKVSSLRSPWPSYA